MKPPRLVELELELEGVRVSVSRDIDTKPEEEVARAYACAHLACERYNESRFLESEIAIDGSAQTKAATQPASNRTSTASPSTNIQKIVRVFQYGNT